MHFVFNTLYIMFCSFGVVQSTIKYHVYDSDIRSETSLKHDCLYYDASRDPLGYRISKRKTLEIIPYCFRPMIKYDELITMNETAGWTTFEKLRELNITSDSLYDWSAPINLIERYQSYLDNPNETIWIESEFKYYNCSNSSFGPYCQFSLYSEISFAEMVNEIFDSKIGVNPQKSSVEVCYTSLTCTNLSCLDWREVCDGKWDCQDGIDEQGCSEIETNVCDQNEYQCHNGQCVPLDFYADDVINPDCIDGTDEEPMFSRLGRHGECPHDPAFRCEEYGLPNKHRFPCGDGSHVMYPLTFTDLSSCENHRDRQVMRSILSRAGNPLLKKECWSAMVNLINEGVWFEEFLDEDSPCSVKNNNCFKFLQRHCKEPLFFFPATPVLFGDVYLMFSSNRTINKKHQGAPVYICTYRMNCSSIPFSQIFISGSTCYTSDNFNINTDLEDILPVIQDIFKACFATKVLEGSQCNSSDRFQCPNSTKCISNRRVVDGIKDCPDGSDEYEMNYSCMLDDIHRFACLSKTKCVSHLVVRDGIKDCPDGEDEGLLVERESFSFTTMCDGFIDVNFDDYINNPKTETDESNCDYWPCNNMYTRCDGSWNCENGADELNCQNTGSNDCATDQFQCVSPDTFTMMCLNASQAGDEKMDCLGGTDEPFYCRNKYLSHRDPDSRRYRCWNTDHCFSFSHICFGFGNDKEIKQHCSLEKKSRLCEVTNLFLGCFGHHFDYNYDSYEELPLDKETNPIHDNLCQLEDWWKPSVVPFILEFSKTNFTGPPQDIVDPATISDWKIVWFCNRGIPIFEHDVQKCLCPPSYYGEQCQYQSQRVSLSFRITTLELRNVFNLIIMLVDNTSRIHSHEQRTFVAARDCDLRYDLVLIYANRPKDESKTYAVIIHVFEILNYRGSWQFPVYFPFLPVYRISTLLKIPSESAVAIELCPIECVNGACMRYINTKKWFCRCWSNWSGISCEIAEKNNCAPHSVCVGIYDQRSICVCPLDKFGPRCLLKHRFACQQKTSCNSNGTALCAPMDVKIVSNEGPSETCLCTEDYMGSYCEIKKARIHIIFSKEFSIPPSIFIHFITATNTSGPPLRTSTFSKIAFDQDFVLIFFSSQFNMMFVEWSNNFYLAHLDTRSHPLSFDQFPVLIHSSQRCLSISELFNSTIIAYPPLLRMKYYHLPCMESTTLRCFYDREYTCLCNEEGHANCFEFEQDMTYDCKGSNYCMNKGRCFQDKLSCPSSMMCVCDDCYYGSRCQFNTKGISLSLDAILGYHIQPQVPFFNQPTAVKVSLLLATLIFVLGLINGILSLITYQAKKPREVGCGVYLFTSSIISLITVIILFLKYWILFTTQSGLITNRLFLSITCVCVDALLQAFLTMNGWLHACVAIERAITVTYNTHFDKTKSKHAAKWVILTFLIFVTISYIGDPVHRRLIDDLEEKRTWCIVSYSSDFQAINSAMNIIHFIVPFSMNIISAVVIVVAVARTRSIARRQQAFKDHFIDQLHQYKHLFLSSIILIVLTTPRLIIALTTDCMTSARDPWLFLVGYFISFIPTLLTFPVFVWPSKMYRNEFVEICKKLPLLRIIRIS